VKITEFLGKIHSVLLELRRIPEFSQKDEIKGKCGRIREEAE
jgi:hypothetical protein